MMERPLVTKSIKLLMSSCIEQHTNVPSNCKSKLQHLKLNNEENFKQARYIDHGMTNISELSNAIRFGF